MDRRQFIKSLATSAMGAGALAAGDSLMAQTTPTAAAPAAPTKPVEKLPQRPLGETGRRVSIIGFGGIVVADVPQAEADARVKSSVERGVNYFDVAPSYGTDGDAEKKLGPALEPYRDKVFLSCKTTRRDRVGARLEFDQSLQRLRTDHFDLYNLHAITDVEKDVEAAFAKDGVMDFLRAAREEGKIRFLGFSAHSPAAAMAALKRFKFDVFLYPVSFVCDLNGKFSQEVFAYAKDRGCGVIALKSLCLRPWNKDEDRGAWGKCWYKPIDDRELALKALRYTLTQPVALAIPPGSAELYEMAVELGPKVTPMPQSEIDALAREHKDTAPIFHT